MSAVLVPSEEEEKRRCSPLDWTALCSSSSDTSESPFKVDTSVVSSEIKAKRTQCLKNEWLCESELSWSPILNGSMLACINSHIRKKPVGSTSVSTSEKKRKNPFLAPFEESASHLAIIADSNYHLILNKFPLFPFHSLIVSSEFRDHRSYLNERDLLVTENVRRIFQDVMDAHSEEERERRVSSVVAMVNLGSESGATQFHRHMHILPLSMSDGHSCSFSTTTSSEETTPMMMTPPPLISFIQEWISDTDTVTDISDDASPLRFTQHSKWKGIRHCFAIFNDGLKVDLHRAYVECLRQCGVDSTAPLLRSHNVLLGSHMMLVVLRSHSHLEIGESRVHCNALVYSGLLCCSDDTQKESVKSRWDDWTQLLRELSEIE